MQNRNLLKSQAPVPTRFAMLFALTSIVALCATALAQDVVPSQYISFDAPQAGTGSGQGTFPNAINHKGWIGGTVVLGTGFSQGFIREPNGSFIAVLPPGAAQSWVAAINSSNETAGSSYGVGTTSGFVRDATGNYTQLGVSGANTTVASGINDSGLVSGFYSDSVGSHGFLWSSKRGYTVFDVPGSLAGSTVGLAINNSGAVAGFYNDSHYYSHCFVRSANGHFTTFEPVYGGTRSEAVAINSINQTTGWGDDGQGLTYGFLHNVGGAESIFIYPEAQGTAGTGINDSGVTVGYYFSDAGGNGAVERDASGNLTSLTLPFSNTATQANGINAVGQVVGTYTDSSGVNHGWVGIP